MRTMIFLDHQMSRWRWEIVIMMHKRAEGAGRRGLLQTCNACLPPCCNFQTVRAESWEYSILLAIGSQWCSVCFSFSAIRVAHPGQGRIIQREMAMQTLALIAPLTASHANYDTSLNQRSNLGKIFLSVHLTHMVKNHENIRKHARTPCRCSVLFTRKQPTMNGCFTWKDDRGNTN